MASSLSCLIDEVRSTGTLTALPDKLFIDGRWRAAASGRRMETFDPGTGRAYAAVAAGGASDVEEAVSAAEAAFTNRWRHVAPVQRSRVLYRAAEAIRANADRLAVVETLDSGKPIGEAQGDIASAARLFEYYAGAADKLQGDTIPLGPNYLSYTLLEPVGVTAHVVPWNYPTSTTARGIAPALAAGCTAVVKPAEQTPLTALMLAEILRDAGLPDGVYNVVTGTGEEAGGPLVAHGKVRHVTFTGSVDTGVLVMQAAARNITSVTLELGGKSPVVALRDCDMEAAVEGTLWAVYSNAGQVCSAGSRLVVERPIHAELVERLAARAKCLTLGHGLGNPEIGAINSPEQLSRIAGYVEGAKRRGVSVAAGGSRTADPETGLGWFFEPTILDDVEADDPVVQEEIFGPVLSVQVVDSPEEAIAAANGTKFGLAAGVYTRDVTKALRIARDVEAGQVYVNEYYAGGVETPFGGTKRSGFGREKGLEALRSYCRVKCVTARI